MRQKTLKKKLTLRKETVSHLNPLELKDSKGGVAPTTEPIGQQLPGRFSRYTDPNKSCNTYDTCVFCYHVQTETPTCYPDC